MHRLESGIRAIPDFPKPGGVFRDVTPLPGDPANRESPWTDDEAG